MRTATALPCPRCDGAGTIGVSLNARTCSSCMGLGTVYETREAEAASKRLRFDSITRGN